MRRRTSLNITTTCRTLRQLSQTGCLSLMMNYLIYGRAEPSRGKARQRKARQGKARQGKARQGKARQGKATQGKARQGTARQGKAGKHVLLSIYKDRLLVSPRRGLGRS